MCLGVPGRIVTIEDREGLVGLVDVGGLRRHVQLACVVDAEHPIDDCVGDWVIVHVGFAMSRVDAEQAHRTLALLAELGEIP